VHAVFRIRVDSQRDRDRVLPRLFRNALNGTIAIFYPPRAGKLVYVAPTHQHYYQRIAMQDPDRIIGVYRNTGDPVALLEALMEDLRDAAARLA
jgi:hypothetical protein